MSSSPSIKTAQHFYDVLSMLTAVSYFMTLLAEQSAMDILLF
jgi:hypothetical protein